MGDVMQMVYLKVCTYVRDYYAFEDIGVYAVQAPRGTRPPYVVVAQVGGGSDNVSPRPGLDVLLRVTVVSDQAEEAVLLADSAYTRLHAADDALALTAPWVVYRCTQVSGFLEVDQGLWHAGGVYRLRAVG